MDRLRASKRGAASLRLLHGMAALGLVVLSAGCDRPEQVGTSVGAEASTSQAVGDPQPFGHVVEFDRFTLRANVSPTQFLSEAMAQRYAVESGPERALLHLVILEKRDGLEATPVLAEVSARYEDLIGHSDRIDMRAVEAAGQVSYIGTLDTSGQRVFRFVIEARPEGVDRPLQINFEAQLPTLGAE